MTFASPSRVGSPAQAAVAPIAAVNLEGFTPDLAVSRGRPAGWVSLADMGSEPARSDRLVAIRSAAGPGGPSHLPAIWELESVAWLAGALVGGPLIEPRTLVVPTPGTTWLRIGDDGLACGIAIDESTDCVTAEHTNPEGRDARGVISALAEPIVNLDPTRSRARWRHVGDRVADALLFCGDALGDRSGALRVAGALLAEDERWHVPLALTGRRSGRSRHTCCLSRRLADATTCAGCPHA